MEESRPACCASSAKSMVSKSAFYLGLMHGEDVSGHTMPSVRRAAISLLRSSPSFSTVWAGGLLELSPVIPTGPMYESRSRLAKKSSLEGSVRMKEVE